MGPSMVGPIPGRLGCSGGPACLIRAVPRAQAVALVSVLAVSSEHLRKMMGEMGEQSKLALSPGFLTLLGHVRPRYCVLLTTVHTLCYKYIFLKEEFGLGFWTRPQAHAKR